MIVDLPRGTKNAAKFPGTGTAHWADEQSAARQLLLDHPLKFYAGHVGKQEIGIRDNRHIITFAGSRAGKGTCAIVPNLLRYGGSAIVLDPKGENARLTAHVRRLHTDLQASVKVLDPFNASGLAKDERFAGSYNPLSHLNPARDTCVDDARGMAESIILEQGSGDSHWTDTARNLMAGLILAAVTLFPVGNKQRSLIGVRAILMQDWEKLEQFLKVVTERADQSHAHYVASLEANAILSTPEEERGSILSTARTQTAFLDSPAMRRVLIENNVDLADLKREPSTLFLCLPAMRLGTYGRWLRLIINLALEAMEREPLEDTQAVLFILDEFHVLGHMAQIERAAGLMAGYGMQLWTILQDLNQLQKHYPKSWETFIGNAGIIQAFGCTDDTTCAYLSKLLGNMKLDTATVGDVNINQQIAGQSGISEQQTTTPLMQPDEVARFFRRDNFNQILKLAGMPPLQLERVPYYKRRDLMDLIYQYT